MNISIDVNTVSTDRFFSTFPEEMRKGVEDFRDRVGFKLEAESKRAAPHVTGNLKRMTRYHSSGFMAGTLESGAHYAKYVHGPPFYTNRTRRRETPFITNAITSSDTFIRNAARDVVRNAIN